MKREKRPPLAVRLSADVEEHHGASGTTYWARVRWIDPVSGRRDGTKRSLPTLEQAERWVERMRKTARTGIDPGQTLAYFVEHIGDRWTRGIDPTSTTTRTLPASSCAWCQCSGTCP